METDVFRTRSGQTGRDAYIYEATVIANLQRELDARMRRLCEAIHDEAPETFRGRTDYHPQLGVKAKDAESLAAYIHFDQDGYIAWLRENR